MSQNITSKYPLLFPPEKTFIEKDKIIFYKDKKSVEIYFKDITSIKTETFLYSLWLWYKKINDLTITITSGKNFELHNITISDTDKIIGKIKLFNPNFVINNTNKSIFNTSIIQGIFRPPKISAGLAFIIIIILSFIAILIIEYSLNLN